MRETFVFEDVLNALIELEKKGYRDYSDAQGKTDSKLVRELLGRLAAAEQRHQQMFEELRDREETLVGATPEGVDPEYNDYLRVLLDANIELPELEDKKDNEAGILRAAIGLEKETILFLREAERILPSDEAKEKVKTVTNEERSHIRAIMKTAQELGIARLSNTSGQPKGQ